MFPFGNLSLWYNCIEAYISNSVCLLLLNKKQIRICFASAASASDINSRDWCSMSPTRAMSADGSIFHSQTTRCYYSSHTIWIHVHSSHLRNSSCCTRIHCQTQPHSEGCHAGRCQRHTCWTSFRHGRKIHLLQFLLRYLSTRIPASVSWMPRSQQ